MSLKNAFTTLVRRLRPSVIVHFAAQTHVTAKREQRRGVRAREKHRWDSGSLESGRGLADRPGVARLHRSRSMDHALVPRSVKRIRSSKGILQRARMRRARRRADEIARQSSARVPVIVARLSNCFGPWQHPEKAIARWTAVGPSRCNRFPSGAMGTRSETTMTRRIPPPHSNFLSSAVRLGQSITSRHKVVNAPTWR